MILKNLYAFCSEELQRTWRAAAMAYETLREMDEMALGALKAYFRNDW